MKVIKIGGGCLKGEAVIRSIVDLIAQRGRGDIFVLSALSGITDRLINGIEVALKDELLIAGIIEDIRGEHLKIAQNLMADNGDYKALEQDLAPHFLKIERYFFGINFTREATPRMRDIIISYGERLSVILISRVLQSRGEKAFCIMPREAGIITDGRFCRCKRAKYGGKNV